MRNFFQEGNARDARRGVKTLAGLPNNPASLNTGTRDPVNMAEDFNQFYCRFDQSDFSQERKELITELTTITPTQVNLKLQQVEVELMLKRMKPNKAPGADQI